MWRFSNPALPTEAIAPSTAPLARIDQPDYYSMAPLARVALRSAQQLPGIEKSATPTTATLILPAPVDGVYTVSTAATSLNNVVAIAFNSTSYTPATDLASPQSGEFTFDPYQQAIAIYPREGDQLEEGLSVQAIGTSKQAREEGIGSTRILPPFPEIFYKIPLTGELSWSRGLEQHPSGSLELDATNANIAAIRAAFKPGTELSFYGIGFRVNSLDRVRAPINEYPAGQWKVSIALGGRHENYAAKPVSIRGEVVPAGSAIAYSDPACVGESSGSTTTPPKKSVSFAELATRAGTAYTGPELTIKIAPDTPRDATTTLDEQLTPRLRVNNCFAFYSDPNAIAARNFYQTKLWTFGEYLGEFSDSEQAIATPAPVYDGADLNLPQPDPTRSLPSTVQSPPQPTLQPEPNLVGYAAQYPCVRLEGKFAEPKTTTGEDTQGRSQVTSPQQSKLLTLTSGHTNPEQPPLGSKRIKNVSLNHDQSGPKKIKKVTTSENGSPLYEETFTYGFAYLARDIANSEDELDGSPAAFWQLVRYEKTSHIYDSTTLYLLGTDTIGWQLGRFKTESGENPETIGLDSGDPTDAQTLDLYRFRPIPIQSKTRYLLKPYREFYKDVADRESTAPVEKRCDRSGSSSVVIKNGSGNEADPEPMFISAEATETICYARTSNPESTTDDPLPDYETGEESYTYKFTKILPSKNTITNGLQSLRSRRSLEDLPDRYVTFSPSDFGQDPGFASVTQEFTFDESEGRPPQATRKNRPQDDGEDGTTDPNAEESSQLSKYILTTPGYDPKTSPEMGNVSYEHAETLEQATAAAKLDLKIRDCKESFQERKVVPFNPWIAEGDRWRDITAGYLCDRRILGVGNKLVFEGLLEDGTLMITSPGSDLTLGLERAIENDVTVHKLPVPDSAATPRGSSNIFDSSDSFNLGELLPRTIPNRRNPFGEETEDE